MKTLGQICILALALSTHAQGFVECIPEYTSPASGGNDGTIGFTFRANADLTVTELGIFSYIFDSVGPIGVAIWDEAGALKGSTVVSNTSSMVNFSRYELLETPISLIAQQVYFIGAYMPSIVGINMVGDGFGGTSQFSPGIQYLGYARVDSTQLTKPTAVAGGEGIVPGVANFRHVGVAVPEPGTLSFLLCAGMAFAISRSRNRN